MEQKRERFLLRVMNKEILMDYDEKLIDKVKGFIDPCEGRQLFETALKASKMGPCLEIGSYCGKSSVYIASACKKNSSILFSVDHHRGSEEQQPGEEYFDPELYNHAIGEVDTINYFRKTIKLVQLEDTIVPVVAKSEIAAKMWTTKLSMVFIDGGHSYEAAYNDYNCWVSHIMPGGYLLVHDIFDDPEKGGQAPYQIYTLAKASGLFKELPVVKTLGVLQRLECGDIYNI